MTAPHATDSKDRWRSWAKHIRAKGVSPERSHAVVQQLRSWPHYQRAEQILIYLAFGDEVDLGDLLEDAKTFHITRTWGRKKGLSIHPLSAGLEQHPYGYWQPRAEAERTPPEQIELVLVPGLCFDVSGARIGYGAAYYDRLLPQLKPQAARVGITTESLLVAALPTEAHDVLMTHIATEKTVRNV